MLKKEYNLMKKSLIITTINDVNDNITLVANAVNLTGEPITQVTELDSIWQYSESDRRFTFGVRARW